MPVKREKVISHDHGRAIAINAGTLICLTSRSGGRVTRRAGSKAEKARERLEAPVSGGYL